MIKYNMPCLMKIQEIKHFKDGKCIWEAYDIPNIWHKEGHGFILSCVFDQDSGITIPTNYYVGLDNRSSLSLTQTLASITGEPTTNGYHRQAVSSTSGFAVTDISDVMTATSGIITFVATGGSWGPVQNLFFATSLDNTGYLISSVALGTSKTVNSGESFSIRVNLSFTNCP